MIWSFVFMISPISGMVGENNSEDFQVTSPPIPPDPPPPEGGIKLFWTWNLRTVSIKGLLKLSQPILSFQSDNARFTTACWLRYPYFSEILISIFPRKMTYGFMTIEKMVRF